MSSTVLVISDRSVFEETWRRALGEVGLNTRGVRPTEVASELRSDHVALVDADSTSVDEDELLALIGFARATGDALAARGHDVQWWPEFVWRAGPMCLIHADPDTGTKTAGADPPRPAYALPWGWGPLPTV